MLHERGFRIISHSHVIFLVVQIPIFIHHITVRSVPYAVYQCPDTIFYYHYCPFILHMRLIVHYVIKKEKKKKKTLPSISFIPIDIYFIFNGV